MAGQTVINRDAKRASDRRYRQAHPERLAAKERARYARNPQRKLASIARYRAANPGKAEAAIAAWQKANPHKRRALRLLRRLKQRVPGWADPAAIALMYEAARLVTLATGEPHEIDHYYPLCGRNVCGLHVANNLQIVTRADNRRKSNRTPA